jgi:hypothetical protein
MSQVIIEIGEAYSAGTSSVHSAVGFYSEEITSSGTAQSTTINGSQGSVVYVSNNGSDAIWVRFDGGTAAVEAGRFIAPNTAREFGPMIGNATVSVINDS